MKEFIVQADEDICRDGQIMSFEENPTMDIYSDDFNQNMQSWKDFNGPFALQRVMANSEQSAIDDVSKRYNIPSKHLIASELVSNDKQFVVLLDDDDLDVLALVEVDKNIDAGKIIQAVKKELDGEWQVSDLIDALGGRELEIARRIYI